MAGLVLGIDPGNSGGAVVMAKTDWGWKLIRCFKLAKGEEAIAAFIREQAESGLGVACYLEKVHGWGEGRSFAFGKYYGFVRGCLAYAGIPINDVLPVKWMRDMGVPPMKGNRPAHRVAMRDVARGFQQEVEATDWNAAAILIAGWGVNHHAAQEAFREYKQGLQE